MINLKKGPMKGMPKLHRQDFDDIIAVEKSLESLEKFISLIKTRRVFYKKTGEELYEFVVFGKYKLDKVGNISEIHKHTGNTYLDIVEMPDVCTFQQFIKKFQTFYMSPLELPKGNEKCFLCGEKFVIEDLKEDKIIVFQHSKCHLSCVQEHKKLKEEDKKISKKSSGKIINLSK